MTRALDLLSEPGRGVLGVRSPAPAVRIAHSLDEVEALGGYRILYSDFHGEYKNGGRGAVDYATLSESALAKLPLRRLGAADSVLFEWATWPNLEVALALMRAWGYTFKTCAFLWVKHYSKKGQMTEQPFTGGGFWTRANTEMVLLGVRGDLRRIDKSVHQLVETWVEEDRAGAEPGEDRVLRAPHPKVEVGGKLKIRHSAKPPEVRDRIVKLMGDLPRIELFARERAPGWDACGDDPRLGGSDVALEVVA